MKNLNKILVMSALLCLSGLNAKAQEEEKSFSQTGNKLYFSQAKNQRYYLSHELSDINGDGINEAILAKYDINSNGDADTYALFLIEKREGDTCHTPDRAFCVYLDLNEDGSKDLYLWDQDSDGILEKVGEYKKSGEYKKEKKQIIL